MARRLVFSSMILLVLALIGCDHATKAVAQRELSGSAPVALVPGVLELRYVENADTAFSLTRDIGARVKAPLLAIGSALGLLGVAALVRRRYRQAGSADRVALACLAAGAIGNVVERVRNGYVIDFIYLHHWPVFNVADVLIVAGGAWLALELFQPPRLRAS